MGFNCVKMDKAIATSEHSSEYVAIRNAMQTEWPEWKKKMYNEEYAVSAHAVKIPLGEK